MTIGVVLQHDDRGIVELIAEQIEAAPDLFVAATTGDGPGGAVLVAGGEALLALRAPTMPVVALVHDRELRAARAALSVGAADIVEWPGEADRLAGAIRRAAVRADRAAATGARIVAVVGARGGVGATTIAAVMAASVDDAVVVDLDMVTAGMRMFSVEEPARTLVSIRERLEDLTADDLTATLSSGPGRARTLHAARGAPAVTAGETNGIVRALRVSGLPAVVDCGRAGDVAARALATVADEVVVVAANDVASIRAVKAMQTPAAVIVRRARRDGVPLRDLVAALGGEPRIVIGNDRALARAADLGRLPDRETRSMRALASLAQELLGARA